MPLAFDLADIETHEWLLFALNTLGIAVILLQLMFDHKRQQRETTIRVVAEISDDSVKLRRKLRAKFGSDLTREQAEDIFNAVDDEHAKLLEMMKGHFNRLERLATGVRMGVYDLAIVDRLFNSSIVVTSWDRNKAYLNLVRKDDPDIKRTYDELEELVHQLRARARRRESGKRVREWGGPFRIVSTK